jgi:hypothetical protein
MSGRDEYNERGYLVALLLELLLLLLGEKLRAAVAVTAVVCIVRRRGLGLGRCGRSRRGSIRCGRGLGLFSFTGPHSSSASSSAVICAGAFSGAASPSAPSAGASASAGAGSSFQPAFLFFFFSFFGFDCALSVDCRARCVSASSYSTGRIKVSAHHESAKVLLGLVGAAARHVVHAERSGREHGGLPARRRSLAVRLAGASAELGIVVCDGRARALPARASTPSAGALTLRARSRADQ